MIRVLQLSNPLFSFDVDLVFVFLVAFISDTVSEFYNYPPHPEPLVEDAFLADIYALP